MLQPIERVNNSNDENSFQDAEDYIEASFNAPEHTAEEQPEHYTSNINDDEIDRLSILSDDEIYDWDMPEHTPTKVINDGADLYHAALSAIRSGITEEFTTLGVQLFLLTSDPSRCFGDGFNANHDMKLANDTCDFKYQMKERLLSSQISIIEAVNAAYSWTDILEHYGYKCIPLNGYGALKLGWVPPESLEDPEIDSDTPTVFLMPADDDNLPDKTPMRYFSLGGKDICGLEFEHIDKFDFLCIREFGGNQYEALLSLTNEFTEIKEHNRLVFNKVREGV